MLEQILAIDQALSEAEALLHCVGPHATSPGVRELLVRHGSLSRVVKGWGAAPPHEAQVAAMLECVTELLAGVKRVCAQTAPTSPRPVQRFQTARPGPVAFAKERKTSAPPPTVRSGDPRTRSTRPPPRRKSSLAQEPVPLLPLLPSLSPPPVPPPPPSQPQPPSQPPPSSR